MDNKYFAQMVAYMDQIVGRIVNQLNQLKLRGNTVIMFLSDNGTRKSIQSKCDERLIRGGKGRTTDAGTRTPLIVNWKGTTPPGQVCHDLVDSTDFLPTLADIAHTRLLENDIIDGRCFLPQLRGERGHPRDWVFCHYSPDYGPNNRKTGKVIRFSRDQRWKLYQDGCLFDIPADVLEKRPLMPGEGDESAKAAREKLQAVLASLK